MRAASSSLRTVTATTIAPAFEPVNEGRDTADKSMDRERGEPAGQEPVALAHEYSPAAVRQYSALATQLYYEQIAPRRYAGSGIENSFHAVAPSNPEVAQAPAVASVDDPAPQTVDFVQPAQPILYPEPVQFVVFSNPRSFGNRCRPASHSRQSTRFGQHGRKREGAGPSGSRDRRPAQSLGHHLGVVTSIPCRPAHGSKPWGTR